jgi:hypothetical protein
MGYKFVGIPQSAAEYGESNLTKTLFPVFRYAAYGLRIKNLDPAARRGKAG